jgi:hypothetical protein
MPALARANIPAPGNASTPNFRHEADKPNTRSCSSQLSKTGDCASLCYFFAVSQVPFAGVISRYRDFSTTDLLSHRQLSAFH